MLLLLLIRSYWGIETGHHARLDVTAMEDASRVRHRNSLCVLGQVRRIVMGLYYAWRDTRTNKRQSTLKDFHWSRSATSRATPAMRKMAFGKASRTRGSART